MGAAGAHLEETGRASPATVLSPAAKEPLLEQVALLQTAGNRALPRMLAPRRALQRVGGWPSSRLPANQTESTSSGVRRIPVEHLAPVARAVVLLPPGFDPTQPAEVLVHMHGANVGYESGPQPRDLDPSRDRIEEQLAAAGRSQMVVVLPQGSSSSAYLSALGRINPRTYAGDALAEVARLHGIPSVPTIRSVVLSGHSGGGFAIKDILGNAARRNDLSGVVWFDAIQAESGPAGRRQSTGQVEAAKALIVERVTAELGRLSPTASDAEKEAALSTGFSFRVYYDAAGAYQGTGADLESFLRALFGESGRPGRANLALAGQIAALPAAARAALRNRYQTIRVPHAVNPTDHAANIAAGRLDTLGHENMVGGNTLLDELRNTPVGADPASTTPAPGAPPPTPPGTTTPAPTVPAPRSTSLDDEQDGEMLAVASDPSGVLMRQVVPEDVAFRLIDQAAALGRADGAGPGGRTLLRSDQIREILAARASRPTLSAPFDASVRAIGAIAQGPGRDAAYASQADGLILLVEDVWIRDPARSSIDLLAPARATHFRGQRWGYYDYPGRNVARGEPAGPLEGEAEAMTSEMSRVRPARRPNSTGDAVITPGEMTPARWQRIYANTRPVGDQTGARLFAEAADSFEHMAQMAAYDGVDLTIVDSYRNQARAAANAANIGNAHAAAAFSSHSLGLAIDLAMSAGTQQFAETQTHPMSNVFGMRSSPAHKWMVLRGESFGWFPYGDEPWHWEYNPPGLRDRFRGLVVSAPPAAPAPAAAPTPGPAAVSRAAAPSATRALTPAHVTALQRSVGNRAATRLVTSERTLSRSGWDEFVFGVSHPFITGQIYGGAQAAAVAIPSTSSLAVRFSNLRTDRQTDIGPGGLIENAQHEGSQVNAMRHVLWNAINARRFGADIATEAADAHEEHPHAIDDQDAATYGTPPLNQRGRQGY